MITEEEISHQNNNFFDLSQLTAQVQAPTETAEEPIAVDVAEEEVDDGVAPAGEITIREHVDR